MWGLIFIWFVIGVILMELFGLSADGASIAASIVVLYVILSPAVTKYKSDKKRKSRQEVKEKSANKCNNDKLKDLEVINNENTLNLNEFDENKSNNILENIDVKINDSDTSIANLENTNAIFTEKSEKLVEYKDKYKKLKEQKKEEIYDKQYKDTIVKLLVILKKLEIAKQKNTSSFNKVVANKPNSQLYNRGVEIVNTEDKIYDKQYKDTIVKLLVILKKLEAAKQKNTSNFNKVVANKPNSQLYNRGVEIVNTEDKIYDKQYKESIVKLIIILKKIKDIQQYNTSSLDIVIQNKPNNLLENSKPEISYANISIDDLQNSEIKCNNEYLIEENTFDNCASTDSSEIISEKPNTSYTDFVEIGVFGDEENVEIIPKQQEKIETKTNKLNSDLVELRLVNNSRINNNAMFFKQMKKYENIKGKKTEFVPLMAYCTTYDIMDKAQLNWYFYWRTEVRNENYIKTDLSYIFVYIYELISEVGWKLPIDGYNKLNNLWEAYREEHPKLDNYLADWTFEFSMKYSLEYKLKHDLNRDFMYVKYETLNYHLNELSKRDTLEIDFRIIDLLSNSKYKNRVTYKRNKELMKEAIEKTVKVINAKMVVDKGKGLLDTFDIKNNQRKLHLYSRAVSIYSGQTLDVNFKNYIGDKEVKTFFTNLIEYIEGIISGRIKSYNTETQKIVYDFLISEYEFLRTKEIKPEKQNENKYKNSVTIDFEKLNNLRKESEEVRRDLEVLAESEIIANEKSNSTYEDSLIQQKAATIRNDEIVKTNANTPTIKIDLSKVNDLRNESEEVRESLFVEEFDVIEENIDDVTSVSEKIESDENKFEEFLNSLNQDEQNVIRIILKGVDVESQLTKIADDTFNLVDVILDEINEKSQEIFDDIIIDVDEIEIYEDYANLLEAHLACYNL